MHLFAVLTTLLAISPCIAVAIPTASPKDTIFAKCHEASVDPYGKIPDDYFAYDKATGGYHFKSGTNAALWAAAQVYTHEQEHEQSQAPAYIGIGMWEQDNCAGAGVWFDNVNYGVNCYGTTFLYSVSIKYRGLRDNEHLDFSKQSGNDYCGQYLYSAGKVSCSHDDLELPVGYSLTDIIVS